MFGQVAASTLDDGRRIPMEAEEVFMLEADRDETLVRIRGRRRLRDVRSLGEVLARFPAEVFVGVHRSRAVNVDRVSEIRRRPNGRVWEVCRHEPLAVTERIDLLTALALPAHPPASP